MKKIIIILLALSLFVSCKDKETEEIQKENEKEIRRENAEKVLIAEERARQIKDKVLKFCEQYNAVTDWEQKLEPPPFEKLFTVQIQDIFQNPKGSPYLFFAPVYDIKKVHGKYLLLANVKRTIDIRHTNYFHLRLWCKSEQILGILQQGLSSSNIYALYVTINSIEKPDLYLRPAKQSDEVLGDSVALSETHPDDIVDYFDLVLAGSATFNEPNENTFIIMGKCENIIFVGKENWTDEISDYKRFRKIFDTNQP